MYVLQDMQCISELGIVVFYVTDVFAVPKCHVSTGLAYVCPVAFWIFSNIILTVSRKKNCGDKQMKS